MTLAPAARGPFPWTFVVPLAVAQLVSWGSLYYAFAVIVGPMSAEFAWSKTSVNAALSVGLAMTGLASYGVGRAIDLHGGRALMTAGSAAATILLFLWSRIDALWQLYAIWMAMGVAFSTVLYEPVFAVIARELKGDYRRGIVIITLVAGLASTVFIPLTHALVEGLGWRDALKVLALIQIPFGIVLHWVVLGRNASGAQRQPPAEPPPPGRMKAAMRSPIFWLLSTSYAAHSFMFTAVTFHILPLLAERGVTMAAAVAAYALVGPAQVAGRIVVFALERRIDVRAAGIVATTLPVLGIGALLLVTPGSPLLYVFAILYGGGMGIKTIVQATAAPEFLGREGYGALQGALSGLVYAVQATTPFLAAVIWSWGGGYGPVLWVLLGATVIAAVAFALAAALARPRS